MKSDILMNKLRTLADGKKVFRMLDELNNLTLDVIAAVSLFFYIYFMFWNINTYSVSSL